MTRYIALALLFLQSPLAFGILIWSDDKTYHIEQPKYLEINTHISFYARDKLQRDIKNIDRTQTIQVLLINSDGGEGISGEQIISELEELKKDHIIICVATNYVASMAFNIFSHCSVRLAHKDTKFIFHKLAYGVLQSDEHERLTAEVLRRKVKVLEKQDIPNDLINIEQLKMSKSVYDMHCRRNTEWSAESLLKRGYLHGIVNIQK